VSALAGLVFCAVFIFIQPHALASGAREVRMFFIGFTASAVGCRLFFGDLGDRRGHREVSLGAVLLYAVAALMCVWLEPELLWLYGLVFGAGHGILYPTLNALVLARLPASRRGLGMALYNGAFNVGMTFGGFGWGLLAAHYGYTALFFTATVVSLLATLPLLADRAPAAA
jgi:MFS family permease